MSWRPKRILPLTVFGKTGSKNKTVLQKNGTSSLVAFMSNGFFFDFARPENDNFKYIIFFVKLLTPNFKISEMRNEILKSREISYPFHEIFGK